MNAPELAISDVVQQAQTFFRSGQTRDVAWRKEQLQRLLRWLEVHETHILKALYQDLSKPVLEAYGSEILSVKLEIRHVLRNLKNWTRRETVCPPWYLWPARTWIQREPYGVVLILAPWNYPLYLTLMPLVAAIAAGNVTVIKPSELAPQTAQLVAEIAGELASGLVSVVQGNGGAAQVLLEQSFDFIFFTGGNIVGRKVGVAAAEKGVPCVLELGGKNPCVVDASAPLELTARRLVWAKFFNAGQTCVAPDYVLVHEASYEPLVAQLGKVIREFYGENPLHSGDLGRLINQRHFERVQRFLAEGKIVYGGRFDATTLRMEPTILVDVVPGATVLKEEIFGPVLPVLPYSDLDRVLDELKSKPVPLALYVHTQDRAVEEKVLNRTRSGSVCINDHILQSTVHGLPFGGAAESGMGCYHGRYGYETFSQTRSVMRQPTWIDNPLRYPPGGGKLRWIKKIVG